MKKTILFCACIGVFIHSSSAQSLIRLPNEFLAKDSIPFTSPNKSSFRSVWYNFIDASSSSNGGAISYSIYTNNGLFPDSTVKQSYADGNGGSKLDNVQLYNVGQVFDPGSFYYSELFSNATYVVDSIDFAYRYSHVISGSVDTLVFQAFYDDAIILGTLPGQKVNSTAWIAFDSSSEQGALAKQEWKITLDVSDTAWEAGYKTKTLALPNPATIKPNGLIAIAYRFIPGYRYNTGDTLDQSWNNPIVHNQINQFQPLIAVDNAKTEEESYNHGLSVHYMNKYAKTGWNNEFIPGDAWNDHNEYVYISFKALALLMDLNPIIATNTSVYPNPSMGSESISIAFTLNENANVSVGVYDLLGNKVLSVMDQMLNAGEQSALVNVSELDAGIYLYRIKAGEQSVSGKLSLIK